MTIHGFVQKVLNGEYLNNISIKDSEPSDIFLIIQKISWYIAYL